MLVYEIDLEPWVKVLWPAVAAVCRASQGGGPLLVLADGVESTGCAVVVLVPMRIHMALVRVSGMDAHSWVMLAADGFSFSWGEKCR